MSLSPNERCVSNPHQRFPVITIIVVVVLASPAWAEVISAYADVTAVVPLFVALSGTAEKYRNHSILRRSAPSV